MFIVKNIKKFKTDSLDKKFKTSFYKINGVNMINLVHYLLYDYT